MRLIFLKIIFKSSVAFPEATKPDDEERERETVERDAAGLLTFKTRRGKEEREREKMKEIEKVGEAD